VESNFGGFQAIRSGGERRIEKESKSGGEPCEVKKRRGGEKGIGGDKVEKMRRQRYLRIDLPYLLHSQEDKEVWVPHYLPLAIIIYKVL